MKTHGHLIFVPSQLLSIETTRGYVSALTQFLTLSPSSFQLINLHIMLEPCWSHSVDIYVYNPIPLVLNTQIVSICTFYPVGTPRGVWPILVPWNSMKSRSPPMCWCLSLNVYPFFQFVDGYYKRGMGLATWNHRIGGSLSPSSQRCGWLGICGISTRCPTIS